MLGAGKVRDHSIDLDRDRAFPLNLYALPAGDQERADDPDQQGSIFRTRADVAGCAVALARV